MISTSRVGLSQAAFSCIALFIVVGAFASDAYLPAFAAIGKEFHISLSEVQFTLTVFLASNTVCNVLHGPLSDIYGRRRVILFTLSIFCVVSLLSVTARTFQQLLIWRVLQGMCAGASLVVGRALIRDSYQGADVQRQFARLNMYFAAGPVVAPLIGGWLVRLFGWRAVFISIFILSMATLLVTIYSVPKDMLLVKKGNFRSSGESILKLYKRGFGLPSILALGLLVSAAQAGLLVLVADSPAILTLHYGLSTTDFYLQFTPMVVGIFLCAAASRQLAPKLSPRLQLWAGLSIAGTAVMVDSIAVPLSILQPYLYFVDVFVYSFGLLLVMPVIISEAMALDPSIAGTISSIIGLFQGTAFIFSSGVVAAFFGNDIPNLHLIRLGMVATAVICLIHVYGIRFKSTAPNPK
jgi:DHA1 family bicyclomycin/chloramphenicol resistance-like MFS transporter